MIIFVCGLPRTGKTTFSKKLKISLGNSNIIVSEALRNAFQKIDNENAKNWGLKNSEVRQKVFPVFAKEFIKWNEFFSNNITIFDCALLNLEQVVSIAEKNDLILCFGFGGRSNNEILEVIKRYEQPDDYTKQFSSEKLLKFWGDLSLQDKNNIAFCKKIKIIYFDTSFDREQVLDNAINKISSKYHFF